MDSTIERKNPEELRKKKKIGGRRLSSKSVSVNVGPKLILGKGATSLLLNSRGCPEGLSPKRPVAMDVDQPSPATKRKKKEGKTSKRVSDESQRKISELWKQ